MDSNNQTPQDDRSFRSESGDERAFDAADEKLMEREPGEGRGCLGCLLVIVALFAVMLFSILMSAR